MEPLQAVQTRHRGRVINKNQRYRRCSNRIGRTGRVNGRNEPTERARSNLKFSVDVDDDSINPLAIPRRSPTQLWKGAVENRLADNRNFFQKCRSSAASNNESEERTLFLQRNSSESEQLMTLILFISIRIWHRTYLWTFHQL